MFIRTFYPSNGLSDHSAYSPTSLCLSEHSTHIPTHSVYQTILHIVSSHSVCQNIPFIVFMQICLCECSMYIRSHYLTFYSLT